MASDEIDPTHFDEDPTLQSLIQECLLAFSEAQARMEDSFELQRPYIFNNILYPYFHFSSFIQVYLRSYLPVAIAICKTP